LLLNSPNSPRFPINHSVELADRTTALLVWE
jgi:hypothetical protein